MEWVAGKALEQIDTVICADNPLEAFRQLMQRRSWLVCIPHLMKTQMDVPQQVCPHIAVQKHERTAKPILSSGGKSEKSWRSKSSVIDLALKQYGGIVHCTM